MFENVFAPENYLQILPLNLTYIFVHFRTLNLRLPIQRGRLMKLPYEDRLCTKCSSADIGDEFHYLFFIYFIIIIFWIFFGIQKKKTIFNHFIVDFRSFFTKKKRLLVNLAHF